MNSIWQAHDQKKPLCLEAVCLSGIKVAGKCAVWAEPNYMSLCHVMYTSTLVKLKMLTHAHRSGSNSSTACERAGGACLELYDAQSNELLCESCPVLGAATPAEGDGPPVEFVAAMTRAELSPPRALAPDQPLRLLSKYNASEGHSGMSGPLLLFLCLLRPRRLVARECVLASYQ